MVRRVIALVIKIKANSPRLSALIPPTQNLLTAHSQEPALSTRQS